MIDTKSKIKSLAIEPLTVQEDRVLTHILNNGSIDPLESWMECGVPLSQQHRSSMMSVDLIPNMMSLSQDWCCWLGKPGILSCFFLYECSHL